MKVTLRADPAGLRKAMSLIGSVGLHGAVLAWVIWAPVAENRTPLFDREIRRNAARIVWYSLKQPLPAVSPTQSTRATAAPRALTRSPQTLVAGKQDLLRPPQLIWTPAPPLTKPELLPSPNIVALNPPARPKLQSFVPLPETQAHAPVVIVPAAPELTVAAAQHTAASTLLPPLARARKTFIPPVEAEHQPTPSPVSVPAAPTLAETAPAKPVLTIAMAKPLKNFTPPQEPTPVTTPTIAEAPQVSPANRPAQADLAIVGLLPTRLPEIPTPKASQQAGFSTGPRPQPVGTDDAPQQSQLVVPGLLARTGSADRQTLLSILEPPTSLHNLMAAARATGIAEPPPNSTSPAGVRIAAAPDPRLQGRMVYSMALQMPNVTSYSGSWMVWFAEREPGAHSPAHSTPGIQPPVPVRKVDPKYVPAAVEERVEGKVRLAAVIRKDGSVDTVEVLRSLDGRLDRSAQEALAQWKFEPARRDGAAIDVDAVFEIPFQLAPRAIR